jgi:hypothetical protein
LTTTSRTNQSSACQPLIPAVHVRLTELHLSITTDDIQGYDVSAELTKLFVQADGQCNDNARAAVRFGFHDAGSWDKSSAYGGADGSLLMDFGEETRGENNGLQGIRQVLKGVQSKYKVGYADLVQYAHNHATISCPKGPRIRTFVGRKDATQAAPTGLLPDVHDSADNLIALFQAKGFSAHDLAALVGAHATAAVRRHQAGREAPRYHSCKI